MDIKLKIGLRIKDLRQHKKLSQEALANIANVDRTYVNSVENGRRNISVELLEKLIIALGTTFEIFFNDQLFR